MDHLVESELPTVYGTFKVRAYKSDVEDYPIVVLFTENYLNEEAVNLRIHSECMTGDIFHSLKCDCGEQLDFSMDYIRKNGGVLIYLRQEGRGIGLVNKLKAYNLQRKGMNTLEANLELGFQEDLRDYGKAVEILKSLGISSIRLITNNPDKMSAFTGSGIEVMERIAVDIAPHKENLQYLRTKKDMLGHFIETLPEDRSTGKDS